jgi:hypothetical protein
MSEKISVTHYAFNIQVCYLGLVINFNVSKPVETKRGCFTSLSFTLSDTIRIVIVQWNTNVTKSKELVVSGYLKF